MSAARPRPYRPSKASSWAFDYADRQDELDRLDYIATRETRYAARGLKGAVRYRRSVMRRRRKVSGIIPGTGPGFR